MKSESWVQSDLTNGLPSVSGLDLVKPNWNSPKSVVKMSTFSAPDTWGVKCKGKKKRSPKNIISATMHLLAQVT